MLIESTPYSIQNKIKSLQMKGTRIGFVPTMGALHAGHLSLITASLAKTDKTIVSIFVNPTQFGPSDDFHTYPRDIKHDIELLQHYNIDILFTPSVDDMYQGPLDAQTKAIEPVISQKYCGVSRPHHFEGVLSVVLRLFNIVMPDMVFLGEKDYQQLCLVKKMVSDLFLPIDVIGCPIVRESDGLAMSSRNMYLTPTERQEAAQIYQALLFAKKIFQFDETHSSIIIEQTIQFIKNSSKVKVDYMAIVDPITLSEKPIAAKHDRILFAGYVGKIRLIDNIAF